MVLTSTFPRNFKLIFSILQRLLSHTIGTLLRVDSYDENILKLKSQGKCDFALTCLNLTSLGCEIKALKSNWLFLFVIIEIIGLMWWDISRISERIHTVESMPSVRESSFFGVVSKAIPPRWLLSLLQSHQSLWWGSSLRHTAMLRFLTNWSHQLWLYHRACLVEKVVLGRCKQFKWIPALQFEKVLINVFLGIWSLLKSEVLQVIMKIAFKCMCGT
jgi:hypothetical protein